MKKPVKLPKPKSILQKESVSGFHFYNLHQCCQRKFYIKYFCRFVPNKVAPALINGSAFHEAKELYYLTGSTKKAVDIAEKYVKKNFEFFQEEADYDNILYRLPIIISQWIDKFGEYDRKQYKFLAIEKEFKIALPTIDGFPKIHVTIKPDAIVQDKVSKDIYIMETKTSGFSIDLTNNGVHYGDQATTYIYAVEKCLKKQVYGVIPDIAYWNTRSKEESNIKIIRGDIVIRKERDLEVWEKSVRQEFLEISQKIEAVREGYDEDAIFRRNTYYCMSYGKPCEYAGICRMKLIPKTELPYGFAYYKRNEKPGLGDYIIDNTIGIS